VAFRNSVVIDQPTFELLKLFAKQRNISPDRAASCFIEAGLMSEDYARRVEELAEQKDDDS